MQEDITNRAVQAKVVEGANRILDKNQAVIEKLDRTLQYLDVNERNVRSIHGMVHDIQADISVLKAQTSEIEKTLKQLQQKLK